MASLGLGLAPLANKRGITAGFLLACIHNIFMRAMLLLAAPVRHTGNGVYYALKLCKAAASSCKLCCL